MRSTTAMQVMLNELPVGLLTLNSSDGTDFRLFESYKSAYPRPVLGQLFLDDLDRIHHVRGRTLPWFSNLLPEGMLRELVARQAGVATVREFQLLSHLAEDLPGAVRLVPEQDVQLASSLDRGRSSEFLPDDGNWHFSLAGVQLKFSAIRAGCGLTIPASGVGGEWIVKLPDARYARVPENEYATMSWARASGIQTPDFELVDLDRINGLPGETAALQERRAFVIRRFDRVGNARVHMEDFAQLLDLFPEQKYDSHNYETIGRLTFALAGVDGFEEFVRRLVFVVISGNGDAHHKNWSLVYPDGIRAGLSPAYDLVSTIHYEFDDRLALNLSRSKNWEQISAASFHRLGRVVGYSDSSMDLRVGDAVARIMDTWVAQNRDLGFGVDMQASLERHFARVGLLRHA